MRRPRMRIYASRRHLAITIALLLMPVVFLFAFARLSGIATGKLFADIGVSLGRLAAAYAIAALLGWGLALAFYRGRRATVALPFFDVLQSFPTFAMLPIAQTFFGISGWTVVFFLVITVVWPIFFSTVTSLRLVKREWEEAAEVMNLRGAPFFRHVLLPVSAPGFVAGSVIGLGEGWEALIATEIVVGMREGLGSFFVSYASQPLFTALGVLGLLLIVFSVDKLVWEPLRERSHVLLDE